VSSLSLVRYRRNDYSVPTAYAHREILIRGYVHEVVIAGDVPLLVELGGMSVAG
jgi:hypothetical protein